MHRDRPLRILVVSPLFAPLANTEAICGGKVALHLVNAGVDLAVCAMDDPKYSRDHSSLWQPLSGLTTFIPTHGRFRKLWSAPLALRYRTLEWSRWVGATIRTAASLHAREPFDLLYTRSLHNIGHIVGYWLARRWNIPWIANFNDPWDLEGTQLPPHRRGERERSIRTRLSDSWLRRIAATANLATFPCSRLRDYHCGLGVPREKSVVIPHIGHSVGAPPDSSTVFRLVHAGTLGAGDCTRAHASASLLRAIRAFLDRREQARRMFQLLLVGPTDNTTMALVHTLELDAYVVSTGRVDYLQSLQRIKAATVCLLIEGDMPEGIFLPSKLPDYVMCRKPVIALSPRVGTVADLLPQPGITVASVGDSQGIEVSVSRYFDAFVAGRIESMAPTERLRREYDGTHIAAQMLALFSDCVKEWRNSHVSPIGVTQSVWAPR